jgi:hypothetical protein
MRSFLFRLVAIGAAAALVTALPAAGTAQAAGRAGAREPGPSRLQALVRDPALTGGLNPRAIRLAGGRAGELYGVAAASATDAWAVGEACAPSCISGVARALLEHWNGSTWTAVPLPRLGTQSLLQGITAVSASDAWATGAYAGRGSSGARSLILHWNGIRWSVTPSPDPGRGRSGLNLLDSVTAVAGDDAWAAGYFCAKNCQTSFEPRDFVVHWNGVRWSRAPYSPAGREITSISATSARNAWALSWGTNPPAPPQLVRWNGSRWSPVPSPRVVGQLRSVTAVSARDAWAVGDGCVGSCHPRGPDPGVILHWNGVRWASVRSPAPASFSVLLAVAASSSRNAWAVGVDCRGGCQTNAYRVLIEHWNGVRWSRLYGPRLGRSYLLFGVSTRSRDQAWAVGYSCPRSCLAAPQSRTLAVRWNGRHWRAAS